MEIQSLAPEPSRRTWIAPLAAAVTAILLYIQILGSGFVYDDKILFEGNLFIRDWSALWKAFTLPFWEMISEQRYAAGYYRPLGTVLFTLIWKISGGAPWAFHLASLLLHAGCAAMLAAFCQRLGWKPLFAALAGMLFAAHGAQAQTVAWASAMTYLMATLFSLFAFCALLQSQFFKAALWLLPAMLSQEIGFGAWLFSLIFCLMRSDTRKQAWPWVFAAFLAVVGLRIQAFGSWTAGFAVASNYAVLEMGFWEELLISLGLLFRYLKFMIWPVPHAPFYPLQIDLSSGDFERWGPAYAGAFLLAAGIVAWFLVRNRSLTVSFGLGLVLCALLPTLRLKSLGVYPFEERFLYLPVLGFSVLAIGLLQYLSRKKIWMSALGAFLVGIHMLNSFSAAKHWQDDRSFYTWAVEASPKAAVSYIGLAAILMEEAQTYPIGNPYRQDLAENAVQLLHAAQDEIDRRVWFTSLTDWQRLHTQLGEALSLAGDTGLATQVFERALQMDSGVPSLNAGMGSALGLEGDELAREGNHPAARQKYQLAIEYYDKALRFDSNLPEALLGRATCQAKLGDVQGALPHFERAFELRPDQGSYAANLAAAYASLGRFLKGGQVLKDFLGRFPDSPEANLQMGELLSQRGEEYFAQSQLQEGVAAFREAEPYFAAVLEVRPIEARAVFGLGRALSIQGKHTDALPHMQKVFGWQPKDYAFAFGLASVYTELRQFEAAAQTWEEYLANVPNSPFTAQIEEQIRNLRKQQ